MNGSALACPLQEQRLQKAFELGPFLDHAEKIINEPISDSEATSDSDDYFDFMENGLNCTKNESYRDKSQFYNFSLVKRKRHWLKEVLLTSSDSDDDRELNQDDLQEMLKEHKMRKKYKALYHERDEKQNYMYYSTGLLSRVDRFPEHQRHLMGNRKKKLKRDKRQIKSEDTYDGEEINGIFEDETSSVYDESNEDTSVRNRHRIFRKKPKKLDTQALTIKRHKLWVMMAKKEVARTQKSKGSLRKDSLQNCKKMAASCTKYHRQKASQSQKGVKEKVWYLKRMTRMMQTVWKKFDRILKDQNKRAEKEAEEQRKMDKEILEAKRQQRKVNFLITLPELYSHFMKNKMAVGESTDETNAILSQLDDKLPVTSTVTDDYDSSSMKEKALRTAQDAFESQQSRLKAFPDTEGLCSEDKAPKDHPQPAIFKGQLKSYQLRGMNWLANLYYFGINGILADEMGLGKTVQATAFLAHICEEYDTWGPFLIVTPASTLHNWTCEINRFAPTLKVVPYWGNPEERKNLRKFFDGKVIGSQEASFHIVVTSYQIVIQDFKFLNRLKWNYMILDEAQAIKSINSQRWKQLLGFSCRNRLLLSGTPIQNSMSELWALLHFIMPTLFDSHNWFNEWFSKDIEGHIENRTTVDESHLSRLHLILKPFMLRRVKTEVENELSDKIEIMMYCPLTLRQKFLYEGLKNKISIDELLRTSMTSFSQHSVSTTLMNLVMQFRKVCNHPELLERREVKSPLVMTPDPFHLPKLIYRDGLYRNYLLGRAHILRNALSIFQPQYVYRSGQSCPTGLFSFLPFIGLSVGELARVMFLGLLGRWLLLEDQIRRAVAHHRSANCVNPTPKRPSEWLLVRHSMHFANLSSSEALRNLAFIRRASDFRGHSTHIIHSISETQNHYIMRMSKISEAVKCEPFEMAAKSPTKELPSPKSPSQKSPRRNHPQSPPDSKGFKKSPRYGQEPKNLPFVFKERKPIVFENQATSYPPFLLEFCPKTHSLNRDLFCCDRSAAYDRLNQQSCSSDGLSTVLFGSPLLQTKYCDRKTGFQPVTIGGMAAVKPRRGWDRIIIPDKHSLIMDAGKLYVLDTLLCRLKTGNHRVLIYSQMTKMIDLLEEYMWHRQHKYMRLDGSSKISDRRDMVDDFQNKRDIFVFLLSTRAGGVGINLTAADTVIFYDSDWNPTVDQQAMDRAHRLGQTKQVTVYRLVCKSTIEERMLQRANEKSEIQRMVISGSNFKTDTLKPKEVVSLLLDGDIEQQYHAKQEEKKMTESQKLEKSREKIRVRMRKRYAEKKLEREEVKKRKLDDEPEPVDVSIEEIPLDSPPGSPSDSDTSKSVSPVCSFVDEASSEGLLIAEGDCSPASSTCVSTESPAPLSQQIQTVRGQRKRGRPRGSGMRSRANRFESMQSTAATSDMDPGAAGIPSKRGRGRPRIFSLGPSHIGTRASPSLPVALGSHLKTSTTITAANKQSTSSSSTQNHFGFAS